MKTTDEIKTRLQTRIKAMLVAQEARAEASSDLPVLPGVIAFPVSATHFLSALLPDDPRQAPAFEHWLRNLEHALIREVMHEAHLAARKAKKELAKVGCKGPQATRLVKEWCLDIGVEPRKDDQPRAAMVDLIHRLTSAGDVVLDPMMHEGSVTPFACFKLGRKFVGRWVGTETES